VPTPPTTVAIQLVYIGWRQASLSKTLDRINTEISLHGLAYKVKQLFKITGTELMMKLGRA
jgi:hypothetical protein